MPQVERGKQRLAVAGLDEVNVSRTSSSSHSTISAVSIESVLEWFQAMLSVLQSAATSSDFFRRAARAVVDLVGLDSGRRDVSFGATVDVNQKLSNLHQKDAMIQTSCFGRLKQIQEAGLTPVAISQGVPKWVEGIAADKRLAPTWAMLRLPREQYVKQLCEQLEKLDAREVYDSHHENAVLLDWETPCMDACHRRIVANWFEEKLGVVVPEFGFEQGRYTSPDSALATKK